MNLIHAIYEPAADGPHPTIIALHGWGANALDLLGLAPHLLGGCFLVLCPQGPEALTIEPGVTGYGWFPMTAGAPPDLKAFTRAQESLLAFVDAAARRATRLPARSSRSSASARAVSWPMRSRSASGNAFKRSPH